MGLYIAPCMIEVFLQYLKLRRTSSVSSVVALLAFLFLVLGLLCFIGVTSYREYEHRRLLWILARIFMGSGSVLWISSQMLWFKRKVRIVEPEDIPRIDQLINR